MSKLDGIEAGHRVRVTFEGVVDVANALLFEVTPQNGFSATIFSDNDVNAPTFQITRIGPAFRVGDEVLVLGHRNGNQSIVGFLRDGRAIVEYQAGGSSNVCAYDISCLTRA